MSCTEEMTYRRGVHQALCLVHRLSEDAGGQLTEEFLSNPAEIAHQMRHDPRDFPMFLDTLTIRAMSRDP